MKIIHGEDYYDHAHCGVDPNIVFVRDGCSSPELTENDLPFYKEFFNKTMGFDDLIGTGFLQARGIIPFYVAAAGEIYPGIALLKEEKKRDFELVPSAPLSVYGLNGDMTLDQVLEFIHPVFKKPIRPETFEITYDEKRAREILEERCVDNPPFLGRDAYGAKIIYDHFHPGAIDSWRSWLIDHKIVTGIFHLDRGREKIRWAVNTACLKGVQFSKVKDGFTLNQDIASYIGGVLAQSEANMVELSDKDRIRKAGFDGKTSFRKMPR